jgi:hypothetical protein
VDGTDGVGVLRAANGDAIYVRFDGLARPAANPGLGMAGYEGAFTVTGGKGRYAGTTGNGTVRVEANLLKGEFTAIVDGMVSVPTP